MSIIANTLCPPTNTAREETFKKLHSVGRYRLAHEISPRKTLTNSNLLVQRNPIFEYFVLHYFSLQSSDHKSHSCFSAFSLFFTAKHTPTFDDRCGNDSYLLVGITTPYHILVTTPIICDVTSHFLSSLRSSFPLEC